MPYNLHVIQNTNLFETNKYKRICLKQISTNKKQCGQPLKMISESECQYGINPCPTEPGYTLRLQIV